MWLMTLNFASVTVTASPKRTGRPIAMLQVIRVIQKMAKQRKDSIEQYTQGETSWDVSVQFCPHGP